MTHTRKKKHIIEGILKIIRLAFVQITFLLSITLLIYGVSLYWIGFHGVDLAHNMINLHDKYNMTFLDLNSNFEYHNSGDVYISSSNQMDRGFIFSIFGMFLLGILYAEITTRSMK